MSSKEPITLARDCEVIEIPSGLRGELPAQTSVRILQRLGGSYTIAGSDGRMYRIEAKDADALGLSGGESPASVSPPAGAFSEKMVWEALKTIYDPEIPVNIVDLGLVYSCEVKALEQGGHRIDIRMAMTAPGCGMANVIKADAEEKLASLPDVREVHVEVVFDPPWSPSRMSEAAKLQLGIDADYGTPPPPLPMYPDKS
jgi:probable FeS assembly SUF system protein SufT